MKEYCRNMQRKEIEETQWLQSSSVIFSQRIPLQIEAAEKSTAPRIEPLCALFRLGRDASSLRALQGMGQKMC